MACDKWHDNKTFLINLNKIYVILKWFFFVGGSNTVDK